MASSSLSAHAVNTGDLVHLVSTSPSATVYPSDDAVLAVLNTRFRSDLPYSRIGTTNLLVLNPYKALANVNDISAKEYEERCYKETGLSLASSRILQPHLYELAAQIYLLMRRTKQSQSVIARYVGPPAFLRFLTLSPPVVSPVLVKHTVYVSSSTRFSVYPPTPRKSSE